MPNWCNNEVRLTFESRREFNKFLLQLDNVEISKGKEEEDSFFDLFIPTPTFLLDTDTLWRDWRIKHWGCKWNPEIYELELYEEYMEITMGMNTPWAPPRVFFQTLTNMFPSLTVELKYDEPGMGLYGKEVYKSKGRKNLRRKIKLEELHIINRHLH